MSEVTSERSKLEEAVVIARRVEANPERHTAEENALAAVLLALYEVYYKPYKLEPLPMPTPELTPAQERLLRSLPRKETYVHEFSDAYQLRQRGFAVIDFDDTGNLIRTPAGDRWLSERDKDAKQ